MKEQINPLSQKQRVLSNLIGKYGKIDEGGETLGTDWRVGSYNFLATDESSVPALHLYRRIKALNASGIQMIAESVTICALPTKHIDTTGLLGAKLAQLVESDTEDISFVHFTNNSPNGAWEKLTVDDKRLGCIDLIDQQFLK